MIENANPNNVAFLEVNLYINIRLSTGTKNSCVPLLIWLAFSYTGIPVALKFETDIVSLQKVSRTLNTFREDHTY